MSDEDQNTVNGIVVDYSTTKHLGDEAYATTDDGGATVVVWAERHMAKQFVVLDDEAQRALVQFIKYGGVQ